VSEIGFCLNEFKQAVASATIDISGFYASPNRTKFRGDQVVSSQTQLLSDIEAVREAAFEHATIDTYAKKLFLTNQLRDFKRLKNVLCVFFVWVQLNAKADLRYDTFLANILQSELLFPKDISVISWNYDSQFEMAFKYYSSESLPIYEKNVEGGFPKLNDSGRIFKVNGSATFGNFTAVTNISKDSAVPPILQLIMVYSDLTAGAEPSRYQFLNHLSFAWEPSAQRDSMMNAIATTVEDTESVVVIGYSFPFFNREIDREIFSKMARLKLIYIQDPNPEAVKPSLLAVLPAKSTAEIICLKDCNQFYLPREL
jgi:hypothetical protein